MEDYQDKMIRHLRFDSHGKYKTGFSMFNIGSDTLTIENIPDPVYAGKMEQLAAYCDESSQITIGHAMLPQHIYDPPINTWKNIICMVIPY